MELAEGQDDFNVDDTNATAMADKMKVVRDSIHYKAKENIDLAQRRYKKDYDKKFCKRKVNS